MPTPVPAHSGVETLYANGVLVYTSGSHAITLATSSFTWGSQWYNGILDEMHLSNSLYSSSWILTEYHNQASPGTFSSIGAETATGGSSSASSTINYVLTDHLGGTNLITDTAGAIVETLDYYPYGATRIDTAPNSSQRKFIGQILDQGTQLYYDNARYYDQARGQFLSEDPNFLTDQTDQNLADPQSLNSYSYSEDNPIVRSDPTGKSALDVLIGLLNAFSSNGAFGAGRIAPSNYAGNRADYARGQALGDLASTLIGAAEAAIGGSVAGGGAAVAGGSAGVLSPVGVPAVAIGSTMAVYGASQVGRGAYNFSKDLRGSGGGSGNSGNAESVGEQIANGHAYEKHAQEFGPGVTREQFAQQANNIIDNPSEVKSLSNGRTAYWDNKSGTVVIHDPSSPDGGTMFRPTDGKQYFDQSLK